MTYTAADYERARHDAKVGEYEDGHLIRNYKLYRIDHDKEEGNPDAAYLREYFAVAQFDEENAPRRFVDEVGTDPVYVGTEMRMSDNADWVMDTGNKCAYCDFDWKAAVEVMEIENLYPSEVVDAYLKLIAHRETLIGQCENLIEAGKRLEAMRTERRKCRWCDVGEKCWWHPDGNAGN